ncbi:hypothetical protein KSU1_B0422 [Candidatus Jettenia caeni]|uniref:Uncharacterized protein n=1 Tax=Candidatus Jettenia caeni TaxID=247490 RepID=I3IHT4_9BACT|nr:hypothetical protein KSU1_B0422 [Candidatus Jettenia caeni]GIL20825.1 MAG: hypothetical protein BroJett041_19390 [Candidatus Jettenia caeni]GJQ47357.1 MAG: hypothetical protein JETCAE04_31110 [Candidatus Jettenia caeni]
METMLHKAFGYDVAVNPIDILVSNEKGLAWLFLFDKNAPNSFEDALVYKDVITVSG